MRHKIIHLIIVGFSLISCRENSSTDNIVLGESDMEFHLNIPNDTINVIPLEIYKDSLLGDISKMIYTDSCYFILDDKTNSMSCYDEQGELKHYFKKQGGGPEEYVTVHDFDIDKENKQIYLLCFPPRIQVLDFKLQSVSVIPIEKRCERLAVDDETIFLYSHSDWELLAVDRETQKTKSLITEGVNYHIIMGGEPVFHHADDELLVNIPGDNVLYKLTQGKAHPYIRYDYKNRKYIEELLERKDELTFRERGNTPPRIHLIHKSADGNFLMIYTHRSLVRSCIIDAKRKTLKKDGLFMCPVFHPESSAGNMFFSWKFLGENQLVKNTSENLKFIYTKPLSNESDLAIFKYELSADQE